MNILRFVSVFIFASIVMMNSEKLKAYSSDEEHNDDRTSRESLGSITVQSPSSNRESWSSCGSLGSVKKCLFLGDDSRLSDNRGVSGSTKSNKSLLSEQLEGVQNTNPFLLEEPGDNEIKVYKTLCASSPSYKALSYNGNNAVERDCGFKPGSLPVKSRASFLNAAQFPHLIQQPNINDTSNLDDSTHSSTNDDKESPDEGFFGPMDDCGTNKVQ
jgi:hypothetical protein